MHQSRPLDDRTIELLRSRHEEHEIRRQPVLQALHLTDHPEDLTHVVSLHSSKPGAYIAAIAGDNGPLWVIGNLDAAMPITLKEQPFDQALLYYLALTHANGLIGTSRHHAAYWAAVHAARVLQMQWAEQEPIALPPSEVLPASAGEEAFLEALLELETRREDLRRRVDETLRQRNRMQGRQFVANVVDLGIGEPGTVIAEVEPSTQQGDRWHIVRTAATGVQAVSTRTFDEALLAYLAVKHEPHARGEGDVWEAVRYAGRVLAVPVTV